MATSLEASLKLRDQFTATLQKINSGLQDATKQMESFKEKTAGPAMALNTMASKAQESMQKVNTATKKGFEAASNQVKSSTERILTTVGSFGNRISEKLNLTGTFSSLKESVSSTFNSVVEKVKAGTEKIATFLNKSKNDFKQYGPEIKAGLSQSLSAVDTVAGKVTGFLKVGALAGTAALVGLGKKVYDIAGGFEAQMSRVQAISGATGESFDQLKKQAIDLGAQTAFSAVESAQGMENLASAGFNAQEIMAAMPGLLDLAAVSGGDIAMASENAATALRGFNMDANQAGHVANVFARAAADTNAEVADMGEAMKYVAPVASSMGLSIEEVAASIGIMSDAGVKGSQAGTTLRGALSRLAKPTDPMIDKMKELGLKFYDAEGQMKPLTEQVGMLQNAFKNLTPEQQQNALVTLYGQESLSGMMALVAKGPDGLAKLTQSLKESDGAAQAMAETMQNNLPAKIEQLGGAIESIFIRIGQSLFPKVGPVIENFTSYLDKSFSEENITSFLDKLSKYGKVLQDVFNDVKGPVSDAAGAIFDSLNKITGGFGSDKNVENFKSFAEKIGSGIEDIAKFAEKHADTIAQLITQLPKVAAAFVGFRIGKGILTPLLQFGGGLMKAATASGKLVGSIGKNFFGMFTKNKTPEAPTVPTPDLPGAAPVQGTEVMANSLSGLVDTLNGFAKKAGNLLLVWGAIKLVEQAAEALKQVYEKIPDDLTGLAAKFGVMTLAIAAMGLFAFAVGKLLKNNLKDMVTGLLVIAGVALDIMIVAEAMQQLNNKVPDDVGAVALKMAGIAIAIGGMGLLVAAVGALMATGIGAIIGGAGLLTIAAVALELMLVAEAIRQMDEKVPENIEAVKNKIDSIATVIGYFTSANLGNVFDLFSNMVGVLNTAVVVKGLQKFEELAVALTDFDASFQQVPTGVKGKITQIQEILSSFTGSDLSTLISNAIWTLDLTVVTRILGQLKGIGEKLNELQTISFNKEDVLKKVADVQEVIDKLGGSGGIFDKIGSWLSGKIDSGSFDTATQSIGQILNIANTLSSLGRVTFNAEDAITKISDIKKVVEALSTGNILQLIGSMIQSAQLGALRDNLVAIQALETPLGQVAGMTVASEAIISRLELIKDVVSELGTGGLGSIIGNMIQTGQVSMVQNNLTAIANLAGPLESVAGMTVPAEAVAEKIKQIGQVITSINTLPDLSGTAGIESIERALLQLVNQINVTITNLSGLDTSFQSTAAGMNQQAVSAMSSVNSTVSSGMNQIVATISSAQGRIYSAGVFAMSGLASGIRAGSSSALSAARSVANQVTSTIQSALKIHSPSRVMMELGGYVSAGLANGILAAKNLVQNASNVLAGTVVPTDLGALENNNLTSHVQLDDDEISRMKASNSQTVVVKNKQVVPQISIHVENKDGEPVDIDELTSKVEEVIIAAMDSDLG